jgi:hypothetical protein
MRELRIPRSLHELLGERQTPLALTAIALAGVLAPALLVLAQWETVTAVAPWRSVLALLLVLDVAAGAVANLTPSVGEHYAADARRRIVFIVVHVHLPVIALLLSLPIVPALVVWAATIAAALVVNALAGRPDQRVIGGLLLAVIVFGAPLIPGIDVVTIAVGALFAFKVAYSFAVRHGGAAPARGPVGPIGSGDRPAEATGAPG